MENYEDIAWEILFGEKLDRIPNPNLPENTALLSAQAKQNRERMRLFVNGPGKVLIDRWKKQLKSGVISLFGMSKNDCNCEICWEVRKIKNIFELILEAESVLRETK